MAELRSSITRITDELEDGEITREEFEQKIAETVRAASHAITVASTSSTTDDEVDLAYRTLRRL